MRLRGRLDVAALAAQPGARSCAATRCCARPSPRPTREPVQIVAAAATGAAAGGRPGGSARGRARGGGAAAVAGGARGGRSTSRAGRCCGPGCCASRRSEHAAFFTMHHIVERRLVDRRAGRRGRGALRRLRARAGPRRCPSCRPVRRLRRLAAAAGWTARSWSAKLAYWRERARRRSPRCELPTDRPRPAVQTFARRGARLHPAGGRRGGPRGSGPAPGRHACSWSCSPPSRPCSTALGPGRPRRRLADRQPHRARARGADRLLRQHPGPAHRPLGRRPASASLLARVRRSRWRPSPTRSCRSRSWSRSCSRSATCAHRRCSR